MKKFLSLILVCALTACLLSGCGSSGDEAASPTAATQQGGSFAPETTAVANSGLAQALASVSDNEDDVDEEAEMAGKALEPVETEVPQELAVDVPLADEPAPNEPDATPEPTDAPANGPVQPFATPTPQPNTTITSYSQVSNTGLGFSFKYPSDWQNIPGRSTVCYIQPTGNGTQYPARVSVSMKQLPHKCNDERLQEQMVEFMQTVMSQYDEETFEVDSKLDSETSFMGNRKSLSLSYLAYDGEQEIQGYYIMTYFERYVFCFHFLCAYEDYEAFQPAMRQMRESVTAEKTELAGENS